MKIPFLNLARVSEDLRAPVNEAVERVMRSGNFILGAEVETFEDEWARFCSAAGAVGVANGTEAITLTLIATGKIKVGDEIITTPLTAGYTALAIVNAGAKPVFVDVDEQTYNLDPEQVERAITPRTRAIIPVHLYGQTAEMSAIHEIAGRHNLFVLEDAAQAHGARFDGKPCGRSSLAATFSFYPTKNLGAYGDGGAIVSDDKEFLRRVRLLRQGGHFGALQSDSAGRNSRLDEIQAAILRVKLRNLEEWNERRRELATIYFRRLRDFTSVRLPFVRNYREHVFHLFVVRSPRRDELKKILEERGIETVIHYPYLLHEQIIFRSNGQKSLPVAEKIAREILSLPLYPQMRRDEVEEVCDAIERFEIEKNSIFSRHANR